MSANERISLIDKIRFSPIRGLESDLVNKTPVDGNLLFAVDTGKIFLDYKGQRVTMGGNGVSLIYGIAGEKQLDESNLCYLKADELEPSGKNPSIGDLIINKDGIFYKIEDIETQGDEIVYSCSVLAISGGGGGGSLVTVERGRLTVTEVDQTDIVNGSDCDFIIKATSATEDGIPIDESGMTIKVEYFEREASKPYFTDTLTQIAHNQTLTYHAGVNLQPSTSIRIVFTLTGSASNKFYSGGQVTKTVTTNELSISWVDSDFGNNDYYGSGKSANLTPTVFFSTSGDRICDIYFDGFLVHTEVIPKTATKVQTSCTLTSASPLYDINGSATGITLKDFWTHGAHKISAILSLRKSDGTRGSATDMIYKEVAIKTEDKPLIWLGEYPSTCYEYDTVLVPYRVYDPNATQNVKVYRYKNGADTLDGSYIEIPVSETNFDNWEITDFVAKETSYYTLRVGQGENETRRDFSIEVLEDPRGMGIFTTNLALNLNARGRTNSEAKKKRNVLNVGEKKAIFTNFNWNNNGWIFDKNERATCLTISNGAKLSLPIGKMSFGSTQSHTIEMRLKITKVQDYSPLIINYTRYKAEKISDNNVVIATWQDDDIFNEFLAQRKDGLTNYDAYLAKQLPILKANNTSTFIPTYDELIFKELYRDYNLDNVAIMFKADEGDISTTPAICFGPQDGFFSNGTNAVSLKFVEDKILNISIVYQGGNTSSGDDNLMKIYLNGMLTGVARSTKSGTWSIGNNTGESYFIFDSKGCDISLYDFRVYNQALGVTNILYNYAYDLKNPEEWDLVGLYSPANDIGETGRFSFNKMITYNDSDEVKIGKKEPIMPYILFTTDDTSSASESKGNLPWYKTEENGDSHYETVDMEFVNPSLDIAYRRGLLESVAIEEGYTDSNNLTAIQDYYLHHCPSWTANGIDLGVQGTSSEFYPRRNYKAKTKIKVKDLDENNQQKREEKVLETNPSVKWTKLKTKDSYQMVPHKGPFEKPFENNESKAIENFYFDNKTVGTNKFTLKIDYMESSGSYNRGLANLLNSAYSHHPLDDYANVFVKEDSGEYKKASVKNTEDYRTTVQGFPVLAFHQTKSRASQGLEPIFIGRYNMLLDKGADEAFGFKLSKSILQNYVKNDAGKPQPVRNVAECWEFENNSRGWCSFRDPYNRKQLSFAAPEGTANGINGNEAPIIVDSFEYRYHTSGDYIDYLTKLKTSKVSAQARIELYDEFGIDIGDDTNGVKNGQQLTLDLYKNWEKAVAWVWSTATDALIDKDGNGTLVPVPSVGSYEKVDLAILYEPNKYYTHSYNLETNEDIYTKSASFDPDEIYYMETVKNSVTSYSVVKLTDNEEKVYIPNKYYTILNNMYIICEDEDFNANQTYYELITDESKIDSFWRLPSPVTYGNTTYNYDTKEYRLAKFKNEISDHFNLEYLATYFIVTEVLQCYDSRGKNCMMASWGPQKEGGEYIWYPIFYDMDTQLGINNTGIPSFEYDINATEEGSFSTNDSVLWNNFYAVFKNLASLKYQQLKGGAVEEFIGVNTEANGTLKSPPFSSVNRIEQWYTCDPSFYTSYSMKGKRPLLALNMDEQYKYITITNENGKFIASSGNNIAVPPVTAGYVGSSLNVALLKQDTANTYFYALQGNRSMSRVQYLTNRFNYIDSWLNLGNYARAGENRIRSRISANNSTNTSDKWIEGTAINGDTGLQTGVSYFQKDEQGNDTAKKTHLFDGEYWITMTPSRNMYVTVGTDAANFPSIKYSGTPIKFQTADLENGVRKSGNYREQLYYIYGLDQMKSLGDLSKLYFQEFYLEGNVGKLVDLNLGYDGLDEEGNKYLNANVNDWTIPGAVTKNHDGIPLLREANFSNIRFKNNSYTLDLSSCEKLTNFRNTGSNITQVTFAKGVALDTLYLSKTTTSLELIEANLLTNLITDYEVPELNEDGKLVAKKGFYIENLTDVDLSPSNSVASADATALTGLTLSGGNLGYDSYLLLRKMIKSCENNNTPREISLSGVQWSPYVLIDDDEAVYDPSKTFYVDDGHFSFRPYDADKDVWKQLIANELLYEYDTEIAAKHLNDITSTELLMTLKTSNKYTDIGGNSSVPSISGIIFINNAEAVDEGNIQKELQKSYPDLKIFFAPGKVITGFAARFVVKNPDGSESLIGTDKIGLNEFNEDNTLFFTNPFGRSEETFQGSYINSLKPTQDFLGWSTTNNRSGLVETYDEIWTTLGQEPKHIWNTLSLSADKKDYIFYAVFEDHFYVSTFVDGDGSRFEKPIVYGATITAPTVQELVPYKDDSALPDRNTYYFMGWARSESGPIVDLSKYVSNQDYTFYAIFNEISVYDKASNLDLFDFTLLNSNAYSGDPVSQFNITGAGYAIKAKNPKKLKGKITIPSTYKDLPIVRISSRGFAQDLKDDDTKGITHIFFEGGNTQEDTKMRQFSESVFNGCKALQYIELPKSLRLIDAYAFSGCNRLRALSAPVQGHENHFELSENVYFIGENAFNQALRKPGDQTSMIFHVGEKVQYFGRKALTNNDFAGITSVIFGDVGKPSQLQTIGTLAIRQNEGTEVKNISIYVKNDDDGAMKSTFEGYKNAGLIAPDIPLVPTDNAASEEELAEIIRHNQEIANKNDSRYFQYTENFFLPLA